MFSYDRFEKILKERNITAYKVGKEAGVATSTLSSWKTGKYIPKIDKLQKIAKYLGVSIDYFLKK